MANWVSNTLVLFGAKSDIDTVFAKVINHKKEFDFNGIVPMPPHQPDLSKPNPFWAEGNLSDDNRIKFGYNNWYDWAVSNWGTKWNATGSGHTRPEKEVDWGEITFETPWSPVDDLIFTLSEQHPDVEFVYEYEEPMMEFSSIETIKAGEYINSLNAAKWMLYNYDEDVDHFASQGEALIGYIADFEKLGKQEIADAIRNNIDPDVFEEYFSKDEE